MKLLDRVAIITGAGSGIGRGTAIRFAQEGAHVIVSDMDEPGAHETVRLAQEAGRHALAVIGSVAVRADAQNVVNVALSQFGKVDILINNAGITRCELDGTCQRRRYQNDER